MVEMGDIHPCAVRQWNEQCVRKTRREVVSLGARVMTEQGDDRAFQKKLGEKIGPGCLSAAAAFWRRSSSVIPTQLYGLRELIIQLHLCLLRGSKKKQNM